MPAGTATGIATGTDERGAYGYLVSTAPRGQPRARGPSPVRNASPACPRRRRYRRKTRPYPAYQPVTHRRTGTCQKTLTRQYNCPYTH